jgi:membrane-associated phospholipid phosphatase
MTEPAERPFWQWPTWRHLVRFLVLGLGVGAWFTLVYGGADCITDQHTYRVRVHLDADLAIPFVPASVVGYMAVYPLFWIGPFVLHTARELRRLALTLATVIAVGGVCFVILPAASAFPPTPDCGRWEELVRFAQRLALTYNYVPSLHVTMSVVCAGIYALYASTLGRLLLWTWASVIALSTLLLHQHYMIDVVTGYLLGIAGMRWVYCPRVDGPSEPGTTRVRSAPRIDGHQ